MSTAQALLIILTTWRTTQPPIAASIAPIPSLSRQLMNILQTPSPGRIVGYVLLDAIRVVARLRLGAVPGGLQLRLRQYGSYALSGGGAFDLGE
jgi:hypothetical protein